MTTDHPLDRTGPKLSTHRGSGRDAEAVFDLLESSGYLLETNAAMRGRQRSPFLSHWAGARRNRGPNRVLLARRDGRPLGTMASTRIHPGTWMIHHIGVDSTARADRRVKYGTCVRLFGGMTAWLDEIEDARSLLVYCDREKHFNSMVYDAYARRNGGAGCSIRSIDVRKCIIEKATPRRTSATILRETPALRRRLDAAIVRRTPAVEARGWGTCASTDPSQPRHRRILYAADHHGIAAALVVDVGDYGANLFSLLNTCRYVPLRADLPVDAAVLADLLSVAITHYQEHCVPEMVFLDDHVDPGPARDRRLASLGFEPPLTGMCFALDSSQFATWGAHVRSTLRSRM